MKTKFQKYFLRALGLLLVLGFFASTQAAETATVSRVPAPTHKVDKIAQGDKCVEPTDEMRRNHMNLLLHQRDQTMHKGIRTVKHSLKNCVDCHATTVKSEAESGSVGVATARFPPTRCEAPRSSGDRHECSRVAAAGAGSAGNESARHADPATKSVLGKDGFCESCHAYTSVKMDCFECHAASPRKAKNIVSNNDDRAGQSEKLLIKAVIPAKAGSRADEPKALSAEGRRHTAEGATLFRPTSRLRGNDENLSVRAKLP